jgi:hypothetical protein
MHEYKVPSQISYSVNSERRLKWGRGISAASRPMIWTKLQLDQEDRLADLKSILESLEETENLDQEKIRKEWGNPSSLAQEPIDIVADYLTEVRQVAVREIKSALGDTIVPRLVTDIVITVPAVFLRLSTIRIQLANISRSGPTKPRI